MTTITKLWTSVRLWKSKRIKLCYKYIIYNGGQMDIYIYAFMWNIVLYEMESTQQSVINRAPPFGLGHHPFVHTVYSTQWSNSNRFVHSATRKNKAVFVVYLYICFCPSTTTTHHTPPPNLLLKRVAFFSFLFFFTLVLMYFGGAPNAIEMP